MKINKVDLSRFLQTNSKDFQSFLFYGDSEVLSISGAEEALEALKIVPSSVKRISEESLLQKKIVLSDVLSSSDLFSPASCVIITHATDKIVPLLKDLPPTHLLFFVQAGLYLGPSSKLRQFYEKATSYGVVACYALNAADLSKKVKEFLKKLGKDIKEDLAYQIAVAFLDDHSTLIPELEKLSLYLGDKIYVDLEDINQVLTPIKTIDLYKLTASVLSKDKKSFQQEYERNMADLSVISLIRDLLSKLLRIHEAHILSKKNSIDMVLKMLTPPIFFTEKAEFLVHMKKWSVSEIEQIVLKLLKLEGECKLNGTLTEDLFAQFLKDF